MEIAVTIGLVLGISFIIIFLINEVSKMSKQGRGDPDNQ